MNLFECPRIDDAAGYVLRALPDSEAESYRHHVTECEECSAKVAELGFVSHSLLSGVPQLSAPPEIRNRVMAVVRAEAELLQAAGAGADRPPRPASRRTRFGFGLRPLATGVLAAVLLALGLGVGMVVNGSSPSCRTSQATVDAQAGAGAEGSVEVCDGNATFAVNGMSAPPDGRIYVLWLDDPKDRQAPRPVGPPFSVRGGKASVDIGKLRGHPNVLVTDEALPGDVTLPTRTPIVRVST